MQFSHPSRTRPYRAARARSDSPRAIPVCVRSCSAVRRLHWRVESPRVVQDLGPKTRRLEPLGEAVQLNAPLPDYDPHPSPGGLKGGTGSPTRSFTLDHKGPGVNRYVSVC